MSCGGLAGRLLESRAHGCAHGAVVFSVASAAGREIRLRWGRGEERRDDRKDEEQQQRDGEEAAHASSMKLGAMGKSAEPVCGYNATPKPWYELLSEDVVRTDCTRPQVVIVGSGGGFVERVRKCGSCCG